jgi:hypothetical protein
MGWVLNLHDYCQNRDQADEYGWHCFLQPPIPQTLNRHLVLNTTAVLAVRQTGGTIRYPLQLCFLLEQWSRGQFKTENYVAYCFAAIPGYSAFGSYTGNGSADGPFVYTGFRPAFILLQKHHRVHWVFLILLEIHTMLANYLSSKRLKC